MTEPSIAEQIAWLRAYVGDDVHFRTPAWAQRRGLLREILHALEAYERAMAVVAAARVWRYLQDEDPTGIHSLWARNRFDAALATYDAAFPPPADAPRTREKAE